MKFSITILGSNSAIPSHARFPSSQVINIHDHIVLVDCGEATQIQMSAYHIKRTRINHIFISHMHGDHIFGLPGLISSYNLAGRKNDLHLYGPIGLHDYIDNILKHTQTELQFQLCYHEFHPKGYQKIFENERFVVFSFPLKHRIPTSAYLFQEKIHDRNIRKEKLEKYNLSIDQIKAAKRGEDIVLASGAKISNSELTHPKPVPRRYAYCSDTIYDESLLPYISHVDLLYHESTYLHNRLVQAQDRMHSTAKEAALIAQKARVRKLVLGHFSSRYKDLTPLLDEARSIFNNTILAEEGAVIQIDQSTA